MIFTKRMKDCEQFRTQNTANIWRKNINARAHLWRENASLRKHPFLLALRRWGRFARRNVYDSGKKFHTDDANQCLRKISCSHGVSNINLSKFICLLVDFGKVMYSSANELQQNSNASSRGDYIPPIWTVLLEILRVYI